MSGFEILLLFLGLMAFVVFRFLHLRPPAKGLKPADARLSRIGTASFWIQVAIGLCFLIGLYALLAFLCGWPFFSQYPARMVVAQGHSYTSLAEMPGSILALALVKTGLDFAAMAVLFALFGLYRRGSLFTAQNVLYIRFQGYYLILSFFLNYQIQAPSTTWP
ncbi:MAG TPA: hypothetical protein VNN22_25090 [Verrucomicrobiae bacterium]|nr:hypothetical protein [Verrucomicrobiae bacterium]